MPATVHFCHTHDHAWYCDAVAAEVGRFVEVLRTADLAAPVPTCPGWTVCELVEHIGSVHRWAEPIVREVAQQRLDRSSLDPGLPADEASYLDWFAGGGARLVATLQAANPDAPTWAWGADQHARFWPRRMAHETTVHRADAELALGREPAIDSGIAVDGIDELLDNLLCSRRAALTLAELNGKGESLHFHATDAEGEWMIRLSPPGYEWEHAHGKGDVAVRGPAADLLLLLQNRRRPEDPRFERFGDETLLARWLAKSAL